MEIVEDSAIQEGRVVGAAGPDSRGFPTMEWMLSYAILVVIIRIYFDRVVLDKKNVTYCMI
jgi:hypothetical protein